jgi:hypothetical protein
MMRGAVALLASLAAVVCAAGCAIDELGAGTTASADDGVDVYVLPPIDGAALWTEDRARARTERTPLRVAWAEPVAISLTTAGTREPRGDTTVWRLRIASPGARFLSLAGWLWLPEGAWLTLHSAAHAYAAGPYTAATAHPEGRFATPAIPTGPDGVIEIELVWPEVGPEPVLAIESVSHGYRDFRGLWRIPRRGGHVADPPTELAALLACEVDVNCPAGADWQDDKGAVAQIYDGSYVCSGTLLSNARENCRNFFLTANHCVHAPGKASSLVFYWNFENSACGAADAPEDHTSVGSYLRMTDSSADLTLLELYASPDASYEVYHAGWSRAATPASSAVTIHHPDGFAKKISIEDDVVRDGALLDDGWGAKYWRVTGWDVGTTEEGSSGAGLWNAEHQVVGALSGGVGGGDGGWDEYGKLSAGWFAGLSEWLDPDGAGTLGVAGLRCLAGALAPHRLYSEQVAW